MINFIFGSSFASEEEGHPPPSSSKSQSPGVTGGSATLSKKSSSSPLDEPEWQLVLKSRLAIEGGGGGGGFGFRDRFLGPRGIVNFS